MTYYYNSCQKEPIIAFNERGSKVRMAHLFERYSGALRRGKEDITRQIELVKVKSNGGEPGDPEKRVHNKVHHIFSQLSQDPPESRTYNRRKRKRRGATIFEG